MQKYIFINNESITHELCNDIIDLFEDNKHNQLDGLLVGGINKTIKNTINYNIVNTNPIWTNINNFLVEELNRNIKKYIKQVDYIEDYKHIDTNFVQYEHLIIQKYIKNSGKYIYHTDSVIEYNKNRHRILTYVWYLNDVEEGGETVFWDNYIVKPEKGKLIIFPSCWTFPHCAKIPVSNDKYIITGWIYKNENKLVREKINNLI